jgi:hypothetical protein
MLAVIKPVTVSNPTFAPPLKNGIPETTIQQSINSTIKP